MNPQAVILDRDGVINKDRGYKYVREYDEFVFLPGVKEALARLREAGTKVVVFTNQSCVAKGLITAEKVDEIHREMCREVEAAGGNIAAVYYCPHDDEDECECRKPLPGMLHQAAKELGLDLSKCLVAGDKLRDIEAGAAVGSTTALVLSGAVTREEAEKSKAERGIPNCISEDLLSLVEEIA